MKLQANLKWWSFCVFMKAIEWHTSIECVRTFLTVVFAAQRPPGPEIAPVIGSSDRLLIDKSIRDQQRPKMWSQIVRARQDASNGGLWSPNGPPEPEIAPVIGSYDRLLIDESISDERRLKFWLQIVRAPQDASNGGLCSPNWPPGPELAPVIGKMYRFLIDILISEA